jgi:SAM-dependent methyltransferase
VLRPFRLSPHLQHYRCRCCGLLETPPACESDRASGMTHHFRAVDPHGAVAASKAGFYAQALKYLDSQTRHHSRVLLDVGCGCGYFLERAAAVGWRTIGVDIVPEMVSAARKRVPAATLFAGDLRVAHLPAGSLDAIAMWDVLDMVPDPAAELAECLRLLTPGGVIGIRIRNVAIQLWLYGCYSGLHRLWRGLGIRPPFVFHRYSFSREAVGRLLNRGGFVRISIHNSPLTQGDPYSYSRLQGLAGMGKRLINAAAGLAFRLSCGRMLWGPSLLVWAQKPSTGLPGSPLRG